MMSQAVTLPENGAVIDVPLNKLKKSPRNARKAPHTEAAIEALAASIAAKGMLQWPKVEPELDADGTPTGCYFVTIGEGRRLAERLRAKRKEIGKTDPVRCVVDTVNDAHEISLDENVTRSAMHPADEFEAFRRLAEERGLGAEEIGARFGVSAHVVRQRLRLGAVSPRLMTLYREDALTLDQLMAFAVSEDHARQEQVYEQLSWNRSAHLIRRAMTEEKVAAHDRRAVFVGAEAYTEAGGTILRDLFTEDGGGWFEDVPLLGRLVGEKLDGIAESIRVREGWKWAEGHLDYPHGHGFGRVYPHVAVQTDEARAEMAKLAEEYDALLTEHDGADALPQATEARLSEIDAMLQAFGEDEAYDADALARAGVYVALDHAGQVRIERGIVRPEDIPAPPADDADAPTEAGDTTGSAADDKDGEEDKGSASEPLPERMVMDLTAHRTFALRDALAAEPGLALAAVVHALALRTFYPPYEHASCLEIKTVSAGVGNFAPGIEDTAAGRRISERHTAWATRLPGDAVDLWAVVLDLGAEGRLDLLAHCAGLTVNAVHNPLDRKPKVWAHADRLAEALSLDMGSYWTPTVDSYLGRVTKARIGEAVTEAVSAEAAERIAGLKKQPMAEAAEQLLAGTGWLPPLLRSASPPSPERVQPDPMAVAAE